MTEGEGYLLHEHDNLRGNHGMSVSRDGDEFKDLGLAQFHHRFGLKKRVHVEEIACGLHLVESQSTH